MHVIKIKDVRKNFNYKWPKDEEMYNHYVEYIARDDNGGEHTIGIGFGMREVYKRNRTRVVVWIDNHPQIEFFGADNFGETGEVLSEIKAYDEERGEHICRYPYEAIPEPYTNFNIDGLPLRVKEKGVHKAWAIVANIADHKTMIEAAEIRRLERKRKNRN